MANKSLKAKQKNKLLKVLLLAEAEEVEGCGITAWILE
jgi:hypothetical protein